VVSVREETARAGTAVAYTQVAPQYEDVQAHDRFELANDETYV
jgi:hypothetical protein